MPPHQFTVHVDPDDLARQDLAATVGNHQSGTGDKQPAVSAATEKHGTRDGRLAARQRSEQARSGRATGGSGRSYAFRRS